MLVSYNALTEEGKAIVGEIRYRKLQEAIALAQKLADTENAAVVVKDQSANGYDMDIKNAVEYEANLFGMTCSTHDKTEGMTAFLEKRKEKNFTDF